MEFEIKNLQKSTSDLMRTIGYQPAYFSHSVRESANGGGKVEEFSIVRQITGKDYPRFHLYIKEKKEESVDVGRPLASGRPTSTKAYAFNLHLDQKKPSYEGQTGHSGDYEGEVVEKEAERIKRLLQ